MQHYFNEYKGNRLNIYIFSFTILLLINFLVVDNIKYECPIHKYLHLWCSGCGGTRMIKAIINLDFYQAFRYNPLLFILLIIFIIYLGISIFTYIKKKVIYLPSYKTLIILTFILVGYMVLRNINYFSYLIPTEV